LDYITAILILPLTALYFVHWGDVWAPLERALIIVFVVLISAIVVQQDGSDSLVGTGLIAGAAILIPILYWIGYAVNGAMQYPRKKCCSPSGGIYFPKYEWGALLAGVAFTAIAVYLFLVQGTLVYSWTWVIHSMWHILAAFGQYYIAKIKAPVSRAAYRVLDADINKVTPEVVSAISRNLHQLDRRTPLHIEIVKQLQV
jgi:hypothetical protein